MTFEFAAPEKIVFGAGKLTLLPDLLASYPAEGLLVTGTRPENAARIQKLTPGKRFSILSVSGEPTLSFIEEARSRFTHVKFVVACGGGSVIDTGKALSAILTNPGPLTDYLEIIGLGQPLFTAPLPFVAIPTTSGSGAEATRNAVLKDPGARVKVSLRSPLMLPKIALIDPELTLTLPAAITASTGLDALIQVIEPFLSSKSNPLTDSICREGILRAVASLRTAFSNPGDLVARTNMAYASLCGGLALANSGLGVVHGFAAPVGGMFDAPHGAVCAALLVHGFRMNWLRSKNDPRMNAKFHEIAALLTGVPNATPNDAVQWLSETVRLLNIPRLSAYGITTSDIPTLVQKAMQSSSMKGNPVPLSVTDLSEVLAEAI